MINGDKKQLTAGENGTAPCFCTPHTIQLCVRNTVEAERSELKKFSTIYKKHFACNLGRNVKGALLFDYLCISQFTYLFIFLGVKAASA